MSGLNFGILITLLDKASAPIRGITRGVGDTSKAAKEGAKDWNNLGKSGSKALTDLGDASKGAASGVTDVTKASGQLEKSAVQSFDAGGKAADKFKSKLSGIRDGIKELVKDSDKLKKLGSNFSSLTMAGTKGMAAGMAAAGAVAGMAALASGAESRLTQISLPLLRADGTSRLDPFKGTIKDLTKATGRHELDVTDAVAGALAENMSGTAIKSGGLSAIMDVALVNGMSERAAGELLAKAGGNFNVHDADYGDIADYLNKSAQTGNTSFESLANLVAGLGERAKNLGIDGARGLKGVSLLTTQFKMSGMEDAAAGSALESLFANLPTLGKKVMNSKSFMAGEFKGILSQWGIGDISKTLFDLNGELRGDDAADKLYNLASVFGEISEKVKNTEDRLTLFKTLLPGASEEAAIRLSKEGWNSAAEAIKDHAKLEEQAAKVRDTGAEKWRRLTTALKVQAETIGKQVLPFAIKLMGAASAVIGKITDWTKAHPGLVKGLALTVGVGGLLVTGVSGLVFTVGLLGNAITSTITGLGVWKGHLASARAFVRGLGNESVASAAKIKALNAMYASKVRAVPLTGAKVVRTGKIARAGTSLAPRAIGAAAGVASTAAGAASLGGAGAAAGGVAAGGAAAATGGTAATATTGILSTLGAIPGIGWIVAAALIVAGAAVVKYWEPIKAVFSGTWEGLKKGWDALAGPAFEEFQFALWGIWDAFSSLLDIFSPFKNEQDAIAAGFGYGESQGLKFMLMLEGVFWVAKWLARVLEGIVLSVTTLVDGIVQGARIGFLAASGQYAEAYKVWSEFKDRTKSTWGNASWNSDNKRRQSARVSSYEELAKEKAKAKAKGGTGGSVEPGDDESPEYQEAMEVLKVHGVDPGILASQPKQTARPVTATINYNPQITIQGGSAPDIETRLMPMLRKHKEELASMVEDVLKKNGRWATA